MRLPFSAISLLRRFGVVLGLSGLMVSVDSTILDAQSNSEGFDTNLAEQMLDLNTVELRNQLKSGLRVFQPEQQAFLETVLVAVDTGTLPRSMVNMVYIWAIRRNPKVPFPYFQIAMRSLAERRGVSL
jgi:hypothetical protein